MAVATAIGDGAAEPGVTFAEYFEKYDPFAITYVEAEMVVHFSQPADLTSGGSAFPFSGEQWRSTVKTVYDENWKLTGIETMTC